MAAVLIHCGFGAQENEDCHCFHFFPPSICHEVMGTMETVTDFIFLDSKSLQMVTAAIKLKDTCPLEEKL